MGPMTCDNNFGGLSSQNVPTSKDDCKQALVLPTLVHKSPRELLPLAGVQAASSLKQLEVHGKQIHTSLRTFRFDVTCAYTCRHLSSSSRGGGFILEGHWTLEADRRRHRRSKSPTNVRLCMGITVPGVKPLMGEAPCPMFSSGAKVCLAPFRVDL